MPVPGPLGAAVTNEPPTRPSDNGGRVLLLRAVEAECARPPNPGTMTQAAARHPHPRNALSSAAHGASQPDSQHTTDVGCRFSEQTRS